ncbi:MAG: hypothetical protein P4M01_09850 [Acidobacteriota bacterium]|nr:hypothetical protein [Acidobacteriota bacterium]
MVQGHPALFAMELLWRWSFGLGMLGLLFWAYAQLRPALYIADGDAAMLHTTKIYLLVQTIMAIVEPLLPVALKVLAALYVLGGLLWALIAATGRGVILRTMVAWEASARGVATARPARRWASYFALHAARVLMLLILLIGYLGGILVASLVTAARPSVLLFVVVSMTVFFAAFLAWNYVNRVLGVAPLFVACDGLSPLDAIGEAVVFLRSKGKALKAANLRGSILHLSAAVLVTLLGVATPALRVSGVVLGLLWLVEALAYFVLADYLHLCRLGNLVAMAVGERAAAASISPQTQPA